MASPAETPLEGWKAIARHLGRSERTAQRWKKKGLPVHKSEVLGVIAYPSEVDAWVQTLQISALGSAGYEAFEQPNEPDREPPEQACASPIGADLRRPVAQNPDESPPQSERADQALPLAASAVLSWCARLSASLGTGIVLFPLLLASVAAPAYALAILMFGLGAVFVAVN